MSISPTRGKCTILVEYRPSVPLPHTPSPAGWRNSQLKKRISFLTSILPVRRWGAFFITILEVIMGKYQKNIEAARRISVMQYLETYHPGELVRKTDKEYCTKTHSSLVITPANGLFHWFSQSKGGNNALDYLVKVEGIKTRQIQRSTKLAIWRKS